MPVPLLTKIPVPQDSRSEKLTPYGTHICWQLYHEVFKGAYQVYFAVEEHINCQDGQLPVIKRNISY